MKYKDDDWTKLEKESQLSDGEMYFVYDKEEKTMYGVMTYEGGDLWNEAAQINIPIEGSPEKEYWIMDFCWPTPPRACSESTSAF